jgi:hypothetical protein
LSVMRRATPCWQLRVLVRYGVRRFSLSQFHAFTEFLRMLGTITEGRSKVSWNMPSTLR